MRSNTITAAVAAAVIGGALTAVAAAPPAHAAKSCNFDFSYNNIPSVRPEVKLIHARGAAYCDVPPSEHDLVLGLELKDINGSWQPYQDAGHNRDIPGDAYNPKYYELVVPCYVGTYRMSVSVTGYLEGNPFAYSKYSGETSVTPDECPSR
ncbi:hypothetical protein [Nocardia sp. NPDC059239]|uniref:hypothetical protein n=1 Tax=unclassified Nocardia TaxID=2637762 RepID=UPI00368962B8